MAETAVEQIRGLGLDPADVRQIAVTHLDLDHAGGLPDFPEAEIHVFAPERAAAQKPVLREKLRYPPAHFVHGPRWSVHAVGVIGGSGSRASGSWGESRPTSR